LPPARLDSIVAALRGLSEHDHAQGRPAANVLPPEAAIPSPTDAMLQLGAQVGAWTERIIVAAFVLAVIGLALELL
jgi:hypothetical protein